MATLPLPAPTSQQTGFSVSRSLDRHTARTSLFVIGTDSVRVKASSGSPGVTTQSGVGFSIRATHRLGKVTWDSSSAVPTVIFSSG